MRSAAWLLVLVACAGSPAYDPEPTPTPVHRCPSCPTCDRQPCPTCPTCPACAECPKPPEPVAADWHCMELTPPRKTATTHCWSSASVCESYRQKVLKKPKEWGKTSACSTHRSAFCFYRGNPTPMSRQTVCTLTLEDCEKLRRLHKETVTETTYLSACQPTRNTDTFTYDDDGNALNYLP